MDNATNNDTLIAALAEKHEAAGIEFNASRSRLRCMPHTIHLAAMKVLEGIGASKKATRNANYQDDALMPLTDAADDEAAQADDLSLGDDELNNSEDRILLVIPKVRAYYVRGRQVLNIVLSCGISFAVFGPHRSTGAFGSRRPSL
jgi:hypothetical protein